MATKKANELSPIMVNIIDTIISIMETKEITPRMLSFDTGIDEGNISKILNKKRGVNIERLYEIMDYLDYEIIFAPKKELED